MALIVLGGEVQCWLGATSPAAVTICMTVLRFAVVVTKQIPPAPFSPLSQVVASALQVIANCVAAPPSLLPAITAAAAAAAASGGPARQHQHPAAGGSGAATAAAERPTGRPLQADAAEVEPTPGSATPAVGALPPSSPMLWRAPPPAAPRGGSPPRAEVAPGRASPPPLPPPLPLPGLVPGVVSRPLAGAGGAPLLGHSLELSFAYSRQCIR